MNDAELLSVLNGMGIDAQSSSAVAMLPMVKVAWAGGAIHMEAIAVIHRVASTRGMLYGDGFALMKNWLSSQPSDDFFRRGFSVLREVMERAVVAGDAPSDLYKFCEAVARVSSKRYRNFGLMGSIERRVLSMLRDLLTVAHVEDVSDLLEEVDQFEMVVPRSSSRPRRLIRPRIEVTGFPEKSQPLSSSPVFVGRRGGNAIQFPVDSWVSRQHCRFFNKNGRWYIADCGSVHGTWVDDEKIIERQLFGGERIRVGMFTMKFSMPCAA